jgi:hypothetical protein
LETSWKNLGTSKHSDIYIAEASTHALLHADADMSTHGRSSNWRLPGKMLIAGMARWEDV